MKESIVNYEKRLIEDRKLLIDLLEKSGNIDDKLYQSKLNYFQDELDYMNTQLNILIKSRNTVSDNVNSVSSDNPVPLQKNIPQSQSFLQKEEILQKQPILQKEFIPENQSFENNSIAMEQTQISRDDIPKEQPVFEKEHIPTEQPVFEKEHIPQGQPVFTKEDIPKGQPAFAKTNASPKKRKDTEKAIGKSLMGILASVLIFISLILFSKTLLPYLTETIKMIIMYLISFGFTGVGLYKSRKNPNNKFIISITACGVGMVYISLLLTNIYFKAIGDIMLYVLITLWAVFVCFLSRLRHRIFHIIGQSGILIALIFGCCLCVSSYDISKFTALIIFYIVANGVFYFSHFEKDLYKNLTYHIFNVMELFTLFTACNSDLILTSYHPLVILLSGLILIHIAVICFNSWKNSYVSYAIIPLLYMILFTLYASRCWISYISIMLTSYDNIISMAIYILAMFTAIFSEWKTIDRKRPSPNACKYILQSASLLIALIILVDYEPAFNHGLIPLITLPITVLGFYRNNFAYKYAAIISLFIYMLSSDADCVEISIWGFAMLSLIYFFMLKTPKQYQFTFKLFLHLTSMLYFITAIGDVIYKISESYDIKDSLIFIILALFNLIMMHSCFAKNLATGKKENPAMFNIINVILMISGLCFVSSTENILLHLLSIFMTAAIFMKNTHNLLQKYPNNIFVGFYIGFKVTVLLITILNSFDAVNYVISIACFTLAIISIVIGFMAQYKSLRIYGLVLSMISIFKLVMIDIHYGSTLGNAVSFFVSGLLCFAISMIYNYIDKKLIDKNNI